MLGQPPAYACPAAGNRDSLAGHGELGPRGIDGSIGCVAPFGYRGGEEGFHVGWGLLSDYDQLV